AAKILAARRTKADVSKLRALWDEQWRVRGTEAAYGSSAIAFHQAGVELAGNKTLAVLSEMINHLIRSAGQAHDATAGEPGPGAARAGGRGGAGRGRGSP